ncbi:hypothetical protein ACM66B_003253 [Microbotryomycetes sp. NB124-2]
MRSETTGSEHQSRKHDADASVAAGSSSAAETKAATTRTTRARRSRAAKQPQQQQDDDEYHDHKDAYSAARLVPAVVLRRDRRESPGPKSQTDTRGTGGDTLKSSYMPRTRRLSSGASSTASGTAAGPALTATTATRLAGDALQPHDTPYARRDSHGTRDHSHDARYAQSQPASWSAAAATMTRSTSVGHSPPPPPQQQQQQQQPFTMARSQGIAPVTTATASVAAQSYYPADQSSSHPPYNSAMPVQAGPTFTRTETTSSYPQYDYQNHVSAPHSSNSFYPPPNPPPRQLAEHYPPPLHSYAQHQHHQQQPQQHSMYRSAAPYGPVMPLPPDGEGEIAPHAPPPHTVPTQQAVVKLMHSLGLNEYTHALLQNGFDRIESLFDIQEEDFEVLGVRRGHRRILQRELASLRGIPATVPLNLTARDVNTEDDSPVMTASAAMSHHPTTVQQTNKATFYLGDNGPPSVLHNSTHNAVAGTSKLGNAPLSEAAVAATVASGSSGSNQQSTAAAVASVQPEPSSSSSTKRRYRRHPKPDPHAPVKPVSAYVAFSHTVREEMKGASFTEIAKTVGERWQAMPKEEREALETEAANAKEAYVAALAAYKATPEFAAHQQYLTDFKRKYAQTTLPDSPPLPARTSSRSGSRTASSSTGPSAPSFRQLPTPSSTSGTPSSTIPLPSVSPSSSNVLNRDGGPPPPPPPPLTSASSYFGEAAINQNSASPAAKRRRLNHQDSATTPTTTGPKLEHAEFDSVREAVDHVTSNDVSSAQAEVEGRVRDKTQYESQSSETGPPDEFDRSTDSIHVVDSQPLHQPPPQQQQQQQQTGVTEAEGEFDSDEDTRLKERQAVAVLAQVVAESSSAAAAAARAAASAVKVVERVQQYPTHQDESGVERDKGGRRNVSSLRSLMTPDDELERVRR